MLFEVNNLITSTQTLVDDFAQKSQLDKHHIDFKLSDSDHIDLVLTRAEAQLDLILK